MPTLASFSSLVEEGGEEAGAVGGDGAVWPFLEQDNGFFDPDFVFFEFEVGVWAVEDVEAEADAACY